MTTKTNLAQPTFNSLNWDSPLNSNFNIVNTATGGSISVNATSNYALSASEAQNAFITVSNSSGSAKALSTATVSGTWVIFNNSSFNLNVYAAAGYTGAFVVVFPGTFETVSSFDGNNMYRASSNNVQRNGDTMTGALALPSNGLNVGSGQLQVSGGNVTATGNFLANQNVTAFSDARLKEDVRPITHATDLVDQMTGVYFTRKDDKSKGVGVIAQDIQKVLPEVVIESENGHLAVAYGNITAVLIEAVKELSARVKELESK
jgi:hypothetical protein